MVSLSLPPLEPIPSQVQPVPPVPPVPKKSRKKPPRGLKRKTQAYYRRKYVSRRLNKYNEHRATLKKKPLKKLKNKSVIKRYAQLRGEMRYYNKKLTKKRSAKEYWRDRMNTARDKAIRARSVATQQKYIYSYDLAKYYHDKNNAALYTLKNLYNSRKNSRKELKPKREGIKPVPPIGRGNRKKSSQKKKMPPIMMASLKNKKQIRRRRINASSTKSNTPSKKRNVSLKKSSGKKRKLASKKSDTYFDKKRGLLKSDKREIDSTDEE